MEFIITADYYLQYLLLRGGEHEKNIDTFYRTTKMMKKFAAETSVLHRTNIQSIFGIATFIAIKYNTEYDAKLESYQTIWEYANPDAEVKIPSYKKYADMELSFLACIDFYVPIELYLNDGISDELRLAKHMAALYIDETKPLAEQLLKARDDVQAYQKARKDKDLGSHFVTLINKLAPTF